jgi:hypothetical protein
MKIMNITLTLLLLVASIFLSSCATTPEAKLKQAYKRAAKTSFDQLPNLYAQLEKEGKIDSLTRKSWTDAWAIQNKKQQEQVAAYEKEQRRLAEKRRREWESLTPAQRYDIELREREFQQQQSMMAFQAEQQRRANFQAALQNFSDSMQRQQELNAYNARTNALSQPVNVNVNGNINHNINGTIYHKYPNNGY